MFKKILAGLGFGVCAIWWLLTEFSAAVTLWPNLHNFWSVHMSGDPWMPWVMLAISVALLAYVFWPAHRSHLIKDVSVNDEVKGPNQSVNIGTMTGGTVAPVYNNQYNTVVAPGRTVLSSLGLDQLAKTLAGRRVNAKIIGDSRCTAIGERTLEQLRERGVHASSVVIIGMLIPAPVDPYSVIFSGDLATLIISPATLPLLTLYFMHTIRLRPAHLAERLIGCVFASFVDAAKAKCA